MIQIMKNRNLILSVLLWVVCSSVFAVTLPSSSYSAFETSNVSESYTLGLGSSFRNTAMLTSSSYEYSCIDADYDKNDNAQLEACERCCDNLDTCMQAIGDFNECLNASLRCKNACQGASLPLGTPLLLLPFIAIYAVLRKRKEA